MANLREQVNMAEPTQTEGTQDSPLVFAHCNWHGGYSTSARLVQIIEQGSGPGGGLYACAACREQHGLVPVADQP
jgi:hypothetical protein